MGEESTPRAVDSAWQNPPSRCTDEAHRSDLIWPMKQGDYGCSFLPFKELGKEMCTERYF